MSILLQIKATREALIAKGEKPGFIGLTLREQLLNLIDVKVNYTLYIYSSISSTPNIITLDNTDQLDTYIDGFYMYELFRNEFVTNYDNENKRNVTRKATYLLKRTLI
jgi:hypothetical protein